MRARPVVREPQPDGGGGGLAQRQDRGVEGGVADVAGAVGRQGGEGGAGFGEEAGGVEGEEAGWVGGREEGVVVEEEVCDEAWEGGLGVRGER